MSDPDEPQLGGWERHQAEQRRAWLRLSYAQRLAWLEEAKALVYSARAGAARQFADSDKPADLVTRKAG